MTYKEFKKWCNERAADGRWPLHYALYCLDVYDSIYNTHFWKREKIWREKYEHTISFIIDDINQYYNKEELKNGTNNDTKCALIAKTMKDVVNWYSDKSDKYSSTREANEFLIDTVLAQINYRAVEKLIVQLSKAFTDLIVIEDLEDDYKDKIICMLDMLSEILTYADDNFEKIHMPYGDKNKHLLLLKVRDLYWILREIDQLKIRIPGFDGFVHLTTFIIDCFNKKFWPLVYAYLHIDYPYLIEVCNEFQHEDNE